MLHLDIVFTELTKQVVLLELTVPWDDRIADVNKHKCVKYTGFSTKCWGSGWKATAGKVGFWLIMIENSKTGRQATKNIMEATEKALRWLWVRRDPCCSAQLDKSQGLITLGWGVQLRVSGD